MLTPQRTHTGLLDVTDSSEFVSVKGSGQGITAKTAAPATTRAINTAPATTTSNSNADAQLNGPLPIFDERLVLTEMIGKR